ncbi:T9SS type A sorting domain-containing protein [Emticicia fontis]
MKKLLIFTCWLVGLGAMAQEQVTDFANMKIPSLRYVQKVDTINGKLVFYIYRTETGRSNLWTTDGTPENTHLLSDSTGESPDLSEASVRQYGYLYLKREYIYRTKGDTLERVIRNIGELEGFHAFNGKVLLYYRNYQSNGVENMNISEFDWLNEDNTRTKWDENVLQYKFIDSTLHYLKFNYQTRLYEIGRLTKNGLLTKNIIADSNAGIINKFEYLSHNGIDYYFFEGEKGRKMVSKPYDSKSDVQLIDWGGQSFMPFVIKDSLQNIYFLKHYGTVSIFALSESNELTEKWNVSISKIYLSNNDIWGNSAAYWHFLLVGDKLIFNSTLGGEGINSYFLNVFDLKTGANKKSKNLVEHFWRYYSHLKISVLDTNTYVLDNQADVRVTYSFLKDSVISVKSYPLKYDSLIVLPKQTVLLSGSVYNYMNGIKTPLIPIKQLYQLDGTESFKFRILNNRIFYWKYNPATGNTDVWASKGEKNDLQLLVSLKGGFDFFGDNVFTQGAKIYFYSYNVSGGMSFYEIDGTEEGTKKIYESSPLFRTGVQNVQLNTNQLVIRLADTDGKGNILIIKNGNVKLVSFQILAYYDFYLTLNDVYITKTNGYAQNLFKVVGDTLKLIDQSIANLAIYNDQLFYGRVVAVQDNLLGLFTINPTDTSTRFLPDNISSFNIFGTRLLYTQVINQNNVFSVIDLSTNKVEVNKAKSSPNGRIQYLNDAIVMYQGANLVIIKNGLMREYNIGFNADYGVIQFNKGVLILGYKNITYYDFARDRGIRVLQDQLYNYQWLINSGLKDNEFFVIPLGASESYEPTGWAYWSVVEERLRAFDPGIKSFTNLYSKGVLSYRSNSIRKSYWYFNGTELIESYLLPEYGPQGIFRYNNNVYTAIGTPETGMELYQLGSDALFAFPEIVKGTEGIDLRSVFEYNNQVYVYGFTYISGWQVWKMSDAKAIITDTESPLEPFLDHFTIYPNPTQDWLYLNSEKPLPYRLINTRGQLLMQGNLSSQEGINMKQLPQGVHLVQLFDGGKAYVLKIVKE